ncbi:Hypothetical_protein [Hexamita inflata]
MFELHWQIQEPPLRTRFPFVGHAQTPPVKVAPVGQTHYPEVKVAPVVQTHEVPEMEPPAMHWQEQTPALFTKVEQVGHQHEFPEITAPVGQTHDEPETDAPVGQRQEEPERYALVIQTQVEPERTMFELHQQMQELPLKTNFPFVGHWQIPPVKVAPDGQTH